MAISSHFLAPLATLPELTEETWAQWKKTFTMLCHAVGASYVPDKTAIPQGSEALDKELNWIMYGKVAEEWRYLLEDTASALGSWKALEGQFQKSTMSTRICARRQFYGVEHDTTKPISIYIQALTSARAALKGLGIDISDTEAADVLLMNLDSSFDTIRTSILSSKDEPTLSSIKSILLGAATSATFVKTEPIDLAHAVRAGQTLRYRSIPPSGGGASRVDNKGIRWCDTSNPSSCHRCGRSGHIAARCIHDMPQGIKDWVMSGSSSASDHAMSATATFPIPPHLSQAASRYHVDPQALHAAFRYITQYPYDPDNGLSPHAIDDITLHA